VLPLPTAVIAVLFGLRHNLPDEVLGAVFSCMQMATVATRRTTTATQATITHYHQVLQPILRWVTRPEVDQRLEQTRREGDTGPPSPRVRYYLPATPLVPAH
jgi:hypothetical protein